MPPAFPLAGGPLPPPGTSHHRVFEKTLFSMMTPEVDAHLQNMAKVKQVGQYLLARQLCTICDDTRIE